MQALRRLAGRARLTLARMLLTFPELSLEKAYVQYRVGRMLVYDRMIIGLYVVVWALATSGKLASHLPVNWLDGVWGVALIVHAALVFKMPSTLLPGCHRAWVQTFLKCMYVLLVVLGMDHFSPPSEVDNARAFTRHFLMSSTLFANVWIGLAMPTDIRWHIPSAFVYGAIMMWRHLPLTCRTLTGTPIARLYVYRFINGLRFLAGLFVTSSVSFKQLLGPHFPAGGQRVGSCAAAVAPTDGAGGAAWEADAALLQPGGYAACMPAMLLAIVWLGLVVPSYAVYIMDSQSRHQWLMRSVNQERRQLAKYYEVGRGRIASQCSMMCAIMLTSWLALDQAVPPAVWAGISAAR